MLVSNSVDYGFSHAIAYKYGIPQAMILNRIIWSINYHYENEDKYRESYYLDDLWWMDDSCEAIARHFGGLFSAVTVRRAIKCFEGDGLLISRKRRAEIWDQTKWYALNVALFESLIKSPHLIKMIKSAPHLIKMINSTFDQNDQIEPIIMINSSSSNSQTDNLTKSPDTIEPKLKTSKYEPEDFATAKKWLEYALREMKTIKPNRDWSAESFASHLRKVRLVMDWNHEAMNNLLQFVEFHPFWASVCTSPNGLLKKNKDGIRKIDQIFNQITRGDRKHDKLMAMLNSEEDPF